MEWIVVMPIAGLLLAVLIWNLRPKSCEANGCGEEQFGNDDKCAICRLPL